MDHVIKGKNTSSALKLTVQPNEYVIADPAYLIATMGDMRITPFQKSGLLRQLADKFKNHTLPLHFIHASDDAEQPATRLFFAAPLHSSLGTIDLYRGQKRQSEIILRQDHFLAASCNLVPDAAIPREMRSIGEWMQTNLITLSGDGTAFIHGLGSIEHITLQHDQDICVDAAHLIAWDSSVTCQIIKSGNFLSLNHTPQWGEQKKLLRVFGGGSIWLQTRSDASLMK